MLPGGAGNKALVGLPVLGSEHSPLCPVLGLSSLLMVTFPVLTQPRARQAMRSFLQAALLGQEHTVETKLSGSPLQGSGLSGCSFQDRHYRKFNMVDSYSLCTPQKETLGPKQALTGNHLPNLASQMLRLWS